MWIRSSTTFYGSFNLAMDRSPGFGCTHTDFVSCDTRPIKTWFPFGSAFSMLNLASRCNSPDRSTKSTRLCICSTPTACKHRVSGSLSLPSRGSFHLSFTVLCAIGHRGYLALRGGPRSFHQGFTCLDVLWIPLRRSSLRLRGFHPLWLAFPKPFRWKSRSGPRSEPRHARIPVWALSRSLAAT